MKKILYEQLVPQELICEKKEKAIIYLPIGPLEWHGPHLGMGVDPINAYGVSKLAALQTGGVVLPPVYMGVEKQRSPECLKRLGFLGTEQIIGMDFPKNALKSLYWPEALFESVIAQYIEMLIQAEYRLIVLVNGHGADNQFEVLDRLSEKYTALTNATVLNLFTLPDNCGVKIGHAGLAETAITCYLSPDGVELERLPAKPTKLKNTDYAIVDNETFVIGPNEDFTVRHDPRDASAELGEKVVRKTAEIVAEQVTEVWNRINSGREN